ncbi:hypothetical protein L211DRAFT_361523 [Terfezia boudieri ATCC MYA-4762]|uniref:Uncharacterized protein n=1 Tax=Terfezia boudieri ATCC MYA-4762 TaxID=1051890 RepID=A0A3N4LZ05_9PEZI|nr:hypothetical protein L211DRAFT_361523 [Terfezia boudieri ATCC MYA-4762]
MFDIVTRAQAVILRSLGEALIVIQQQAGITPRHIRNLYNEAQTRDGVSKRGASDIQGAVCITVNARCELGGC